ncbi:hypothetical protein [Tumebacillus flagellatus]|uniref:DUF5132 domain-containing protein n=1 Tax=Tumebacillus flagellatus TaxID=1157490 RepID=A0A074LQX6_9BACL|nr:hypothetical protein [Tumebacillus flagellatus]KEO82218.1 hypothetical protein EL26_16335 [Tumebacillus flagellatus]
MKWNPTPEGIVTGIGLTLATAVLFPVLREIAKPIAAAGVQSASSLSHQLKSGVAYVREEIEDIVAEAQWERMKKSIDLEIAEGEGTV